MPPSRFRGDAPQFKEINAADLTRKSEVQKYAKFTNDVVAPASSFGVIDPLDCLPSTDQKHHHNLAYLAFEAKQKEFDLMQKNEEKRRAKLESRRKYGW